MFFLFSNGKAIVVCMCGILVGMGLAESMHASEVVANCGGALTASILDLLFRVKVGDNQLLDPREGGHIFFVPVWMWGIVWIFCSLGHRLRFW